MIDSKILESLMINDETVIATEGVIGVTLGAILAGYALLILGIDSSVKNENKKNNNDYASKTGITINNEIKKNVNLKQTEISKDILKSFTKLQSNSTYMNKLRQAIAKKLNIDINKIPNKFRPIIDNFGKNILIRFITDDEVSKLYDLTKNDDFDDSEFGYWINEQLNPTFNKIITSIKNSGIPELDNKLLRLETADHWQECGIYVTILT